MRDHELEPVSYPAIDKIRFEQEGEAALVRGQNRHQARRNPPKDYFGLDISGAAQAWATEEYERRSRSWQRTAEWAPVEREASAGDAVLVDYVHLNPKGNQDPPIAAEDALVGLLRSSGTPSGQEDGGSREVRGRPLPPSSGTRN